MRKPFRHLPQLNGTGNKSRAAVAMGKKIEVGRHHLTSDGELKSSAVR